MRPIDLAYRDLGFKGVAVFLNNNPNTVCNEVLNKAAAHNDRATVELVLPHSDPKHGQSLPLRRAVNNGHYDMVEFLLPYSDATGMKCSALLRAVEQQDLKMVALLLPHSDPNMRRSLFLRHCVYHDFKDIAQLLWPLSNIEVIRRDFIKQDDDHSRLQLQKMDIWEREFQHENIEKSLGQYEPANRVLKI